MGYLRTLSKFFRVCDQPFNLVGTVIHLRANPITRLVTERVATLLPLPILPMAHVPQSSHRILRILRIRMFRFLNISRIMQINSTFFIGKHCAVTPSSKFHLA